jgi:hypothetical protein
MRKLKMTLASCALATAFVSNAVAQNAVYLPSQDAPVRTLLDKRKVLPRYGSGNHSPAEVNAYRAVERQIVDRLMALPAVNAPAAGICTQVASWADMGGSETMPILGGEVRAVLPTKVEGRCSKLEGSGVVFRLNDLRALGETVPETFRIKGDLRFASAGVIEVGTPETGQMLIFHRPGAGPVTPLLAREFLTQAIAGARKDLAEVVGDGLGLRKVLQDQIAAREADLARVAPGQQACVKLGTADQELDLGESCGKDNRLWSVDRGYFTKGAAAPVQLVVVSTDPAPQRFESSESMKARLLIWEGIDRAWLQGLVR